MLLSGFDVTLTRTGRHADGESRALETRRGDEGPLSTILHDKQDKTAKNFDHRPERRGDDVTHHHLGSRLSTTCIIGASSEFTQI